MVKAVIFDFMQTLGCAADGYKHAEKNSQKKLFEKLELHCWDEYMELYRDERKNHFLRSDFSRKNVWVRLCSHYKEDPDPEFLSQLEEEYWEIVKNSLKLFPETVETLEQLKKKYRLGLVSNSQKDGTTKALDNDKYRKVEKYFDAVVIAGEDGIPAKPDPLPFRMVLDKLCVRPEEAVYVGDDYRIDIEGSKGAGMIPVWLKHYSVERNWPVPAFRVAEITTLNELIEMDKLIKKA